MATTFLRADIQSCQKTRFLATSCLRKSGITSALIEIQHSFYAHFKENKMPFPMTYYTNIFSTVMFSRSSDMTFDLVFLKMQYFNFFEKIYCVYVTIIKNICKYQVGTGFCEAFYCEESLLLY
jgi:hypothetical protein